MSIILIWMEKNMHIFFIVCTVFWLIMDPNLVQKMDQISVSLATFSVLK